MADISETVLFRDICAMLEKVKGGKNIASKEKYIKRYYESFCKHRQNFRREHKIPAKEAENGETSFYCVLRCLVPGADNGRGSYGLQITALGKVYIKVLQLATDSPEAQRLYARTYSGGHSDYADIVYKVLQPRCTHEDSSLTLKQVHDMLDSIANDTRQSTEKELTRLSELASAQEQKWFIRLLLKNMHLGIGEQRVFAVLHPQLKQLYQRCTNLSRVCCLLADNKLYEPAGTKTTGAGGDGTLMDQMVVPFQHIRPMLCEVFPGNMESLMASDVLYMETKMDGERFHVHCVNGRFKYISRNGIDYTYSFGANFDEGPLTSQLQHLLPIDMHSQSMILDGEMMVYDTEQKRFRHKGENTDVKHLSGRSGQRPCFVVFDLLYWNGSSLLDLTYAQRMHKLKSLISEQTGVLQLVHERKLSSLNDFKVLFQQELDANQEGVVLKKQNSVYRPGVRQGGGWYKVKADYIEGLTTEFDLLIMGGYYNRTRTFIESFLLGVLEYSSPEKFELYSVGKVMNNIRQRAVLNDSLKRHWRPVTTEPPPLWYHYISSNAEGRPDVWIQPSESTILQIKAADLAPSSAFSLSKSLHFPRVQAWRNDKVWNECMSLREYKQMSQGKQGLCKINKRELRLEDLTTVRKLKRLTPAQKRKLGMQSYEKKFNAKDVKQNSKVLEGFSLCLLSGQPKQGYTAALLKQLAVRNGAEIVENPLYNDPKCIVLAGDSTYRVESLKKSRRYNIVSLSWLLRICDEQELRLTPIDMICTTAELEAQFARLYDEYGDSYTEPVTPFELKEIFDSITDEQVEAYTCSDAELKELAKLKFPEVNYI